jgi:peptide/nickel transport system substrate-binding protein
VRKRGRVQFLKVAGENCTRPLFLALSLLLVLGCSQPPPEPGVITVAMYTSVNSLDPRYATDSVSSRAHHLIFNSLLDLDDKMQLTPDLAESWESADYQTYVMHLRNGVRFHDGHELTSDDVVYTFTNILDPKSSSPLRGAFRLVDSVKAVDRYTVSFTLKEPSGSFLINLVAVQIVPRGADRTLREHPIGTGPYEFVSHAVDDRIVLRAFRDYFGGLPRNRGVVLKVVPDDIMRALELRKRTVDLVVNDIPPDMAYQLRKEGLSLATSPGANYQYLGFNMRDPILADVRVRHAIGYAIDRQAIIDHLRRGLAMPSVGVLSPTNWAFEPNVFDFTYDPDRARELLDEAGYRDPDGDGPRPRFTLSLKVSSTEFNRLQSAVLQENLHDVGIATDVRVFEFATLYADILKGNFQMYTLQWAGGATADPDILSRIYHSRQVPPTGFNRGHLSDPELDRLIDEATSATTPEERRVRYGAVQQRAAELAPYISLWHETNIALAQPEITGIHLAPQVDYSFLRNVSRTE